MTAATLVSISVTPAMPSIAKSTTQQFVATGTYSDATTQTLTDAVTWASATTATATISNAAGSKGLAAAIAEGTSTISATLGAVNGSTTLTVTPAKLVSIAVTPATPSIAKGTKQQFVATGTYSDATTQDLSDTVTWASATPATATISNAADSFGLATGVATGSSVISATLGAVKGSTTLTVTAATLVSIAVTPAVPSIAKGTQQQFIATGFFDDASTQDVSDSVTWASSTASVATVSNAADSSGLASALATGTTKISAAIGAISGSTTLTVTPAKLVSIAVTPATPSIAKGTKQQFVATGTYSDATTQDLTQTVTWASATAATATISNGTPSRGLASSVAVGSTDISATSGAVIGKTTLTVTAATLASLAVTPATPSIAKGTKQQFVAIGTYSDATTQDLTGTVTWASATTATATISNAAASKGLASAVAEGTTVISATSGTIVGMTTLTVSAATLVSIAVTPAVVSIAKGATQDFVATGTYSDASTPDSDSDGNLGLRNASDGDHLRCGGFAGPLHGSRAGNDRDFCVPGRRDRSCRPDRHALDGNSVERAAVGRRTDQSAVGVAAAEVHRAGACGERSAGDRQRRERWIPRTDERNVAVVVLGADLPTLFVVHVKLQKALVIVGEDVQSAAGCPPPRGPAPTELGAGPVAGHEAVPRHRERAVGTDCAVAGGRVERRVVDGGVTGPARVEHHRAAATGAGARARPIGLRARRTRPRSLGRAHRLDEIILDAGGETHRVRTATTAPAPGCLCARHTGSCTTRSGAAVGTSQRAGPTCDGRDQTDWQRNPNDHPAESILHPCPDPVGTRHDRPPS